GDRFISSARVVGCSAAARVSTTTARMGCSRTCCVSDLPVTTTSSKTRDSGSNWMRMVTGSSFNVTVARYSGYPTWDMVTIYVPAGRSGNENFPEGSVTCEASLSPTTTVAPDNAVPCWLWMLPDKRADCPDTDRATDRAPNTIMKRIKFPTRTL